MNPATPPRDPSFARQDVEALHQLVAALAASQREESIEGFVGLFRADAIWTTGHGRRLFGRDEIEEFTRSVLPGAGRDGHATYDVEHIRQYVDRDGMPGASGSPLYVAAKERGVWLLVACQNTTVV